VKVCPATEIAPVREPPELAATVNASDWLPLPPEAPSVIQVAGVAAVHVHPVGDVTAIDPVPPPTGTD
jgi:hypothetical protein